MENENKNILKAKEILEEISRDEHERYLADLREKYIMDQKATELAGYDKGKLIGLKEGKLVGIKESQIQIAKNLLKENLDISLIAKTTGLTIEEIKQIQDSINN